MDRVYAFDRANIPYLLVVISAIDVGSYINIWTDEFAASSAIFKLNGHFYELIFSISSHRFSISCLCKNRSEQSIVA
uniref:Uncharacterized protein n=1 Tax=Octopus bimaculoides TaxID=37653 RepID=A0A0L8GJ16_OCTBM